MHTVLKLYILSNLL